MSGRDRGHSECRGRIGPVYEATERRDGYVSLESSPYLAMNTDATVAEARRPWRSVGRDNLMIKVPATKAGLPAIRQLTGEGINVNITCCSPSRSTKRSSKPIWPASNHLVAQRRRPRKSCKRRELLCEPYRRAWTG